MKRMASTNEQLEREEQEHLKRMSRIDNLILIFGIIAVLTSPWWLR